MAQLSRPLRWIPHVGVVAVGVSLAMLPPTHASAGTVMKIAHQTANDYQDEIAHRLAALAGEKSGGYIRGQVFSGAQLGPTQQQQEGVIHGVIEVAIQPSGAMTSVVREFGILDLPFLFRDDEEQNAVLNGAGGEALRSVAERQGFIVLSFFPGGFRDFATVFPLRRVDDFRGRKFRVIESPELIGMIESWGGIGIPMPFPEIYTALQQRTIDGLDNAPDTIAALKFHEPARYYTITRHGAWSTVIVASRRWFMTLPPHVQTAVREAAQQVSREALQIRQRWVAWALETVERDGASISRMAPAELERMEA
ncbi:MAG TPA: TRAP transporter substrate-binding protein, partial [Limnochorda sp.]